MKHSVFAVFLAFLPSLALAVPTPGKVTSPKNASIKVAVVISDGATVIDFAGPWEVFQDTSVKGDKGEDVAPFDLYTVAPTKKPIHTTGNGHPGLTITPDYSFADAPTPDIVVIGAQSGGPGLTEWLKKVHADHKVIMSVCTGAFKLAATGLLNGKEATTHHWYFGNFARQFPDVKLVKQVRYAEADPITFSAGGLSSGIDLALHVVDDYFGEKVAQETADYMEYEGTGWKTNKGISVATTPVTRQDWTGKLASGKEVVLHMTTYGASPEFTTDIPAEHVAGARTSVNQHGKQATINIDIAGHPATFVATPSDNQATLLTGTFSQDGKSSPLTLTQGPKIQVK
ncbi:MAG: DJ-1/PfpI family protein [Gammaproteobacteria bacterium]